MRPILRFKSTIGINNYIARDFNTAAAPEGKACPASTIKETFEPDLSPEWQRVAENGDCEIAVDAGGDRRMNFSDGDAVHDCVIHTSTLYDLRRHQVEIEIAEVVPAMSVAMRVEFEVETRTSRGRMRLDVPAGVLRATVDAPGAERSVGEVPFGASQFGASSVWRVSGTDNDRLIFEVGDGETFQTVGATQVGDVGALDQVRVRVVANASGLGLGAGVRLTEIRSK